MNEKVKKVYAIRNARNWVEFRRAEDKPRKVVTTHVQKVTQKSRRYEYTRGWIYNEKVLNHTFKTAIFEGGRVFGGMKYGLFEQLMGSLGLKQCKEVEGPWGQILNDKKFSKNLIRR